MVRIHIDFNQLECYITPNDMHIAINNRSIVQVSGVL